MLHSHLNIIHKHRPVSHKDSALAEVGEKKQRSRIVSVCFGLSLPCNTKKSVTENALNIDPENELFNNAFVVTFCDSSQDVRLEYLSLTVRHSNDEAHVTTLNDRVCP